MAMTRHHRAFSLVFITVAAGLLGACNSAVQGGEGGGGTGGAAASGGDTGSAASTTTATARWVTPELEAELCGSQFPCDIPDASILLVLDSAAPACGVPIQRTYGSGDGFRVAVAIPPEMQLPGTYVLQNIPNVFTSHGYELGGGATGSGSSRMGSIEVVAIDDLEMTIRTTGLTEGFSSLDANGNPNGGFDSDGEWVTSPCE
jgi:hypothetical protein